MEEKTKKFNLLELLSRAKAYEITQNGDTYFEIKDYGSNLIAEVRGDDITYYITDSVGYDLEIDMKALNKIKAFCECITREIE